MPARPDAPSGAPVWIDLFTTDPDRAAGFYGALFGWVADAPSAEHGGYVNFRKDGVVVAGMMGNDGSSGQPDAWTVYLSVPDAQATVRAAAAAGGQVHLEPMPVDDLGTMALVADPGGAAIGIWQPGGHRGTGLRGEPGTPYWHELHTRDYAAVLDFYRATFGWETRDVGDASVGFHYTQMVVDGQEYAGVMDATGFLPDGMPSTWSVYLTVADVDATIAQAVELGGAVVQAAESTPFGRLATITDPTGAVVKLATPVA
jgi:predicted enzyme related to lactoylglutathione lyase